LSEFRKRRGVSPPVARRAQLAAEDSLFLSWARKSYKSIAAATIQDGRLVRTPLTFRELETAASAFLAVFLAFLHTAVAGQVARVAQALDHAERGPIFSRWGFAIDGRLLGRGRGRTRHAGEHVLEGAGQTLAD